MKKYIILSIVLGYCLSADAQQGLVSVGGDGTGPGGSVSYSLGQLAYSSVNSTAGILIEGLQQPGASGAALPVSLLYFKATANNYNKTVQLLWAVASQNNSDHFTVERSQDATYFSKIINVEATSNSSIQHYSTEDHKPYTGKSYYRLQQVLKDGSSGYSSIEEVLLNATADAITAGPNPAREYVTIFLKDVQIGGLQYRLYDVSGHSLALNKISSNTTQVNLSGLSAGMYMLQVIRDGKIIQSFKIVKQ